MYLPEPFESVRHLIVTEAPHSRERSLALTNLEQAYLWYREADKWEPEDQ